MATPGAGSGTLPATYVEGWHDEASVRRTRYSVFGDRMVSALSLGCSSLAGVFRGGVTLEECCKVVEYAVRSGVNLLDTAPWYGHGRSEEVLGEALKGIPRRAYYLHTKVGRYQPDPLEMFDFSYERTLRSVDESLKRMRVEYLDTVQGACGVVGTSGLAAAVQHFHPAQYMLSSVDTQNLPLPRHSNHPTPILLPIARAQCMTPSLLPHWTSS